MIFDTHLHLNLNNFSEDQNQVLARAREAGVGYALNVGIDLETSVQSIEIAEQNETIFATVGLHPHDAEKFSESYFREMKSLAKNKQVKAVGEIGLDYFRNLSPKEVQKTVFKQFVGLANEIQLPLVIHSREAYADIYSILKSFGSHHRGVMHCFSGNKQDLEQALELGLHISFAGPVTYKKNDELRALAGIVPADRILVETDAPYLPPEPYRGKRNEPGWIVETVKKIAEVRKSTFEEISTLTTNNAKHLFNI